MQRKTHLIAHNNWNPVSYGSVARDQRLMQTIDTLNCSGKNVFFASEGLNAPKPWQTKFNHSSAPYTTNWNELVEVV
jgi:hypothetical protein